MPIGRVSFFWAMRRAMLVSMTMTLLPILPSIADEGVDWRCSTLVVPQDDKSGAATEANAKMAAALTSVVPPTKGEQVIKTGDGPYVLCGDLFRRGKGYALVELVHGSLGETEDGDQIGVGFAAWNGKAWEFRGLWRITPGWMLVGGEESGTDGRPKKPSDRPFWIQNLCGIRSVVVAGAIDRWGQDYYVFGLDDQLKTLNILERSERKPEMVDGYARFLHSSGRKSDWAEWLFWYSKGSRLLPAGAWRADATDCDNPRWVATAYAATGQESAEYLIECNQPDCSFKITRNGELYAKVTINRPNAPNPNDESEAAYLFEKLTALSRSLYQVDWEGAKPKRLEDLAKITVTGSTEAVKKLSPKQKN